MKVFSAPEEIVSPVYDFGNPKFDWQKADNEYIVKLRTHLFLMGYRGSRTGQIFRTPMGDGYAQYMLAEGIGRIKSILVHLPLGDAWHSRDVQFLPKKEVIRRIDSAKEIAKLFSKKG